MTKQAKRIAANPLTKRRRGRPVTKPVPELIPDTPENVAQALLSTPPVPEGAWEYLKKHEGKDKASRSQEVRRC